MKRRLMMCGNWKMNKNYAEAVRLAQDISFKCDEVWSDVDVVLIPPAVDLKGVANVLEFDHSSMQVGAQNCHWEASGAYTGEIAPGMIADAGCKWCLVGHSERREMFGETDETVNKKVRALFEADITPIVCVGESLECRVAGGALEFVMRQVEAALAGLTVEQVARVVVAYEPIWSIGTGRTPTPEMVDEVCSAIHDVLERIGGESGKQTRVLYGGSMNPGNVKILLDVKSVDGGLIGGAALKADSFADLVNAAVAETAKR